ncbi:MAG TPA: hypothetical protein VFH78_06485 [Candidatus Thermoplasmatota archaeon]|nr:hypothetical protein [Candidatus Thermoplasmatota archaeon]
MASGWVVPLLAGVVAGLFAARVWGEWSVRRRAHQLAWAVGLSLYAVATLVDAYAATEGWNELAYRLFFATAGANVGFLGLGTVLLTRSRVAGRAFAAFVVLASLVAALAQLAVPLDPARLDGTASHIPFPHPARLAFLLLNVVGGLALIVGAVVSWWQTRRVGVLLIGVGALFPFLGGSLSTLASLDLRVLFQFLGIVVMFVGYLRGRDPVPPEQAPRPADA